MGDSNRNSAFVSGSLGCQSREAKEVEYDSANSGCSGAFERRRETSTTGGVEKEEKARKRAKAAKARKRAKVAAWRERMHFGSDLDGSLKLIPSRGGMRSLLVMQSRGEMRLQLNSESK